MNESDSPQYDPTQRQSAQPIHLAPFSNKQQDTLNALLNLMIPPSTDGRMPGAGTLGLFDDCASLPAASIRTLQSGLTQIGSANEYLSDADPLNAIQSGHPTFFELLKLQTIKRYYEHSQVLGALNIESTPPWPRGHSMDSGDLSRLDAVRSRGPIYRKP